MSMFCTTVSVLFFKSGFKTGDVYGAEQQYTLHAALNILLNVPWDPIDLVLCHQRQYILSVRLCL